MQHALAFSQAKLMLQVMRNPRNSVGPTVVCVITNNDSSISDKCGEMHRLNKLAAAAARKQTKTTTNLQNKVTGSTFTTEFAPARAEQWQNSKNKTRKKAQQQNTQTTDKRDTHTERNTRKGMAQRTKQMLNRGR